MMMIDFNKPVYLLGTGERCEVDSVLFGCGTVLLKIPGFSEPHPVDFNGCNKIFTAPGVPSVRMVTNDPEECMSYA